jgi:hypothetical protein
MTRRLEDLKMLNVDRWKAQVDENRGSEGGDGDQLMGHGAQPPAPTGGSLFNLSNPTHDGEFVKPYVRQRDAQAERFRGEMMWIDPKTYQRVPMPADGGKDWMTSRTAVPTSGDDFSSVALGSVHKYRIPPTSVTRKMGDCRLFGCCGWRLTAVSCAAPGTSAAPLPHPPLPPHRFLQHAFICLTRPSHPSPLV